MPGDDILYKIDLLLEIISSCGCIPIDLNTVLSCDGFGACVFGFPKCGGGGLRDDRNLGSGRFAGG